MPHDKESLAVYEKHRREAEEAFSQLDMLVAEHAAAIHRLRLLVLAKGKK